MQYSRRNTLKMLSLGSLGILTTPAFATRPVTLTTTSQVINRNIPADAKAKINAMTGSPIATFAFNSKDGWVIVTKDGQQASNGIAPSCLQQLKTLLQKGHQIECIAFPPKGADSWVIVTDKKVAYANIPKRLQKVLDTCNQKGTTVKQVVFQPRRDNDRWLVLTDKTIYAERMPDECLQMVRNLQQPPRANQQPPRTVHQITISPTGGWAVFADDFIFGRNMPDYCWRALNSLRGQQKLVNIVAFSREGWSIVSNGFFESPPMDEIRLVEKKIRGGGIWARMKKSKVPGVSIAVVMDNKVVWSCGYGYLKAGNIHAMHNDSVFQTGSLSQVFSTIGAMRLTEQGKIKLDSDLRKNFLKEPLPIAGHLKIDKEENTPTLGLLLAHRCGFNVKGLAGYTEGLPIPELGEMLAAKGKAKNSKVEIKQLPNGTYQESAGGFMILDQLIHDLTGQKPDIWLNQNVLKPLNMKDSTFELDVPHQYLANFNVAAGHNPRGGALRGDRNRYPETSAYGLSSTATDVAQLIAMLNQGGRYNHRQFLSTETVENMLTPINHLEKGTRGIGLKMTEFNQVSPSGINFKYWNAGVCSGFRSLFFGFPIQKAGVVVLSNGNAVDGPRFCYDIANAVCEIYGFGKE